MKSPICQPLSAFIIVIADVVRMFAFILLSSDKSLETKGPKSHKLAVKMLTGNGKYGVNPSKKLYSMLVPNILGCGELATF